MREDGEPDTRELKETEDAPELHHAHTIQQVVHPEFEILHRLEYEVSVWTPPAGLAPTTKSLVQRQQETAIADIHLATQLTAAHFRAAPFNFLRRASQVSSAAWIASILLWCWLFTVAPR